MIGNLGVKLPPSGNTDIEVTDVQLLSNASGTATRVSSSSNNVTAKPLCVKPETLVDIGLVGQISGDSDMSGQQGVHYSDGTVASRVTYLSVCKQCKSFLSLDISVNSTGWVEWYNNVLSWGKMSMRDTSIYADDMSLQLAVRRKHFKDFLLTLIGSKSYQMITVEDVIGGVNFKTNRNLFQLNTIVDDLVMYGLVPYSKIIREDSDTWKRYLRSLSSKGLSIKGLNDKDAVRVIIHELGFNIGDTLKEQDMYDALGMALGVIANRILKTVHGVTRHLHNKISSGYKIKQCKTLKDAQVYAEKIAVKHRLSVKNLGITDSGKDLQDKFRRCVNDSGDSAVFCIESETCKLGVLALSGKISLSEEVVYLVAYRQSCYGGDDKYDGQIRLSNDS